MRIPKTMVLCLVVAAAGCKGERKPSQEQPAVPAKREPGLAFEQVLTIRILPLVVEVDGVTQPPLERARLETTEPDARLSNHLVWRLSKLLGEKPKPEGRMIEVIGETRKTALPIENDPEKRELAFVVDGSGQAHIQPFKVGTPEIASPEERLSRSDIVTQPSKIRVFNQGKDRPALGVHALKRLAYLKDGEYLRSPAEEMFAKIPELKVEADPGKFAQVYYAKDLVRVVFGDGLRIGGIHGLNKDRIEISPAAWDSTDRRLALRVNRHGVVKAVWLKPDGEQDKESQLKDVTRIELISLSAPVGAPTAP